MSHPDLLASHLQDEDAVATVNLSGEDVLVITPTRSLLYESEGILSDESISEYAHDVDGISVSDGRRKSTIELTYPIAGTERLRVPKSHRDTVLHYILAGIFHAKGITESGESVHSVFQFNELTLVVTSERVLTHVGSVVWDDEYEEFRFADLTGLQFAEGNIATELVLYIDGRSQRIKIPKGRTEEVKLAIQQAVFDYYDVDSIEAFKEAVGFEERADTSSTDAGIFFDDAVKPLRTEPGEDEVDESPDPGSWPYEPLTDDERDTPDLNINEIRDTLQQLQSQIDDQREAIDAQEATLAAIRDLLPDE